MDLKTNLKKTFGFDSFRDGQESSIHSFLDGFDTFSILPTGAGKSLIYLLPASMLKEGLYLVISPLISLMKEQAEYANQYNIPSSICNSTQSEIEQLKSISLAVQGKIQLLFVSPERAVSQSFLKMFTKMPIKGLIVDEAHCVSQWGHDFRPEYRMLHKLREAHLNKFPILALTATATARVKMDVVQNLSMNSPKIILGSFFRKNLNFRVEYPNSENEKKELLLEILSNFRDKKKKSGRAIVYCSTRAKVDEVYTMLKSLGFPVAKYHAGRTDSIRGKVHDSYNSGKTPLLIATNAFGMGLDQPDVRYVIHYQIPSSLEAYYQEAGRGGRDGNPSECILLYRTADFSIQSFLISKEANRKGGETLLPFLKEYAEIAKCRQSYLCGYFGEKINPCGSCDLCLEANPSDSKVLFFQNLKEKQNIRIQKESYQFSEFELSSIKKFIEDYPGKWGKNSIIAYWKGSKSKDSLRKKLHTIPGFGEGKHIPEEAISKWIEDQKESKILLVTTGKYPKLYFKDTPPTKKPRSSSQAKSISPESAKMKNLKNYRDRIARKLHWKKYMVLQNGVIKRIVQSQPKSLKDLKTIKGLGEAKIEKFGEDILKIINE